ncbi:CHAD domain-containing protein [Paraburkholderia sp. GAS199]|uniref:CHAD domain-containing protein n=1 Tax=Paraburkholderia sp. GAS199 TaxID=3035126 RepID=UPI003D2119F8
MNPDSADAAKNAAQKPRKSRKPAAKDRTAQAAFASYASPLIDHAIAFADVVRDDASPEALHALRVSLRRLRSLWWAFQPLLDKPENIRQQALYKYLATAAGKTRDWDILIELVASDGNGKGESESPLHAQLEAARGDALATSRETLANADVKHLLHDTLTSTSKELNTSHERVALRKFATRRVAASGRSLKKRMKRASKAKRSNYAAFHDVRKAGKKLRYLLEFFGPDLRGGSKSSQKRSLKRLKKIQKHFGKLNDIVASETLLRENTGLLADEHGTAGALQRLAKERKRRVRAAAGLLRKH